MQKNITDEACKCHEFKPYSIAEDECELELEHKDEPLSEVDFEIN
jgi:hypothetical protein